MRLVTVLTLSLIPLLGCRMMRIAAAEDEHESDNSSISLTNEPSMPEGTTTVDSGHTHLTTNEIAPSEWTQTATTEDLNSSTSNPDNSQGTTSANTTTSSNNDPSGTSTETTSQIPHCGDGILDPGEECDDNEENGQPNDNQHSHCTSDCKIGTLKAFVTSTTYTGDLGGLSGANEKCIAAAKLASIANSDYFVAWLGAETESIFEHYSAAAILKDNCNLPYYLMNGQLLSSNIQTLLNDNKDKYPITISESGTTIDGGERAWSAIAGSGAYIGGASIARTCSDWTSESEFQQGHTGNIATKSDCDWNNQMQWTACKSKECNESHHLYCFEKCPG